MSHVKPTQAELDAQIQASIAAAEAPETPPANDKPPVTTPEPVKKDESGEPAPVVAPPVTTPEPVKKDAEPEPTEAEKEAAELKKRVANSSRENQIILAQNKKMSEAINKASEVVEPTEEELLAANPNWEDLSDFEKRMAKKDMISDRRFAALAEASKDFKDLAHWQTKVEGFIEDPENLSKFPLLEGKETEFKFYALQDKRRGVDFEDLVAGFLFTADMNKPKNRGAMFPVGSAGGSNKPPVNDGKLSVEESAHLRDTDYSKYRKALREGKISDEIK